MLYHTSKGELGTLTSLAEKKKTSFALGLRRRRSCSRRREEKQFAEREKKFHERDEQEEFLPERGGGLFIIFFKGQNCPFIKIAGCT